MRLIDADEMLANESEAYMSVQTREDVSPITQGLNSVVHRKIQQLIADTPTVDAVEVVRCRDCVHYEEWTDKFGAWRYCNLTDLLLPDGNGYCNHGERVNDNATD